MQSQASWNQLALDHAPHPHNPDASDVRSTSFWQAALIKPLPFQWVTKICHHSKSDQKVLFSRIQWCGFFITHSKWMICWRKPLPTGITVHACCSTPRRDSRSHLEHDLHDFHCVVRFLWLASFSSDSHNSCCTVLIVILIPWNGALARKE